MSKIDFKKELKHLYKPSAKKVSVVDVPKMNFLMVDGSGSPGASLRFEQAIETLYPVAFTLKFMSKLGPKAQDYVVPPLEGLWWADDMSAFVAGRREEWKWTLMIMQPEFIGRDMVGQAVETVRSKQRPELLDELRFESYEEGECAQILHVGPFADEGPTVEAVHAHIESLGRELSLKHHEIYLSDPRRADPEKLKTVVRQPMR